MGYVILVDITCLIWKEHLSMHQWQRSGMYQAIRAAKGGTNFVSRSKNGKQIGSVSDTSGSDLTSLDQPPNQHARNTGTAKSRGPSEVRETPATGIVSLRGEPASWERDHYQCQSTCDTIGVCVPKSDAPPKDSSKPESKENTKKGTDEERLPVRASAHARSASSLGAMLDSMSALQTAESALLPPAPMLPAAAAAAATPALPYGYLGVRTPTRPATH